MTEIGLLYLIGGLCILGILIIMLGFKYMMDHYFNEKHIKTIRLLPKIKTEQYLEFWIAYLEDIPGMTAQGKTKKEAIDALMISIKVKLMYEY